jgi:hypothetical protein
VLRAFVAKKLCTGWPKIGRENGLLPDRVRQSHRRARKESPVGL